jgi:hypothetical protein
MAKNPTVQQTQRDPSQARLKDLRDPPAPARYRGLRVGPEMALEWEDNQAQPMDASNSTLRMLSPFIIQVEPPLVVGSEPASYNPSVKGSRVTGLYGAALKQRAGFTSARAALAMTTYVNGNYGPGTVEEVITRNSASRSSGGTRNASGDKTRKTDGTGTQTLGKLGEPAVADLRTAVDIATQLKAVLDTPPLVLLINPQSLSIAYNKIQAFQDRTRFGYVFQAWGEEQPRLTFSAKCGAFISGGRGVQFASRRDSASWQNLMTAFQFYRNNGYIHDTVGKSNAHLLVGALSIRYDQWIYFGHMQSVGYGFDEETMHGGIVFEMEFVVSAMVDTAEPTFNVQPMRGPNPRPGDTRYSGRENQAFNRPGETSFDLGQPVPSVRTGTSSVLTDETGTGLDDPDFRPVPQPRPPRGQVSLPVGTRGFQSPTVTTEPEVAGAPLADVQPFRFGDPSQQPSFSPVGGG